MIKRVWWLLTHQTIRNCLRKADIKIHSVHEDESNTIEAIEQEIDLPECVSIDEFNMTVDCDIYKQCYGDVTDAEIFITSSVL